MTIIKINKDGKLVLKNKPDELAIPLVHEDTEQPRTQSVHIEIPRSRRPKIIANVILLILALLVLTAGVVGGIYLYRHMTHKHRRNAKLAVQYNDLEKLPTPIASHQQQQQQQLADRQRNGMFLMMEEQMDIEFDENLEKIQVPKFDECRSSVVIHDFYKNLTAIVDNDDRECFILDLDKKMTPPKELDEVISRYFSGYYMPKVSVIRNDYVVIQPPLTDLTFAGPFIGADCRHYNTYRLEKRIMPREIIEIRFECKTYGYSDMKTLVKDSIFK